MWPHATATAIAIVAAKEEAINFEVFVVITAVAIE